MSEKYEELLERAIRCHEQSAAISNSLLEVAKRIEESTKNLNDQFILHQNEMKETSKDVKDIKLRYAKWLTYLALVLFIIMGGARLIEIITGTSLF